MGIPMLLFIIFVYIILFLSFLFSFIILFEDMRIKKLFSTEEKKLTQDIVDITLRKFAKQFYKEFYIKKSLKENGTEKQRRKQKRKLRKAKKVFWEANRLAKKRGFEVGKNFEIYLPEHANFFL